MRAILDGLGSCEDRNQYVAWNSETKGWEFSIEKQSWNRKWSERLLKGQNTNTLQVPLRINKTIKKRWIAIVLEKSWRSPIITIYRLNIICITQPINHRYSPQWGSWRPMRSFGPYLSWWFSKSQQNCPRTCEPSKWRLKRPLRFRKGFGFTQNNENYKTI